MGWKKKTIASFPPFRLRQEPGSVGEGGGEGGEEPSFFLRGVAGLLPSNEKKL